MNEFFTVIKIFMLSILILVLLQMKWQGMSLEKRAVMNLHQSQIGQTIEDVAMGATKVLENGYSWAKGQIASVTKQSNQSSSKTAAPAEPKASR